jgi:hypothetical protein
MNFLRLIHFLKLIKRFGKRTHTISSTCQHQGAPHGMLTSSAGGSGPLTSAVGPTDISVDRSTLTSQRSIGSGGQWVLLVRHTISLIGGTHVSGWA